MSVLDSIIEGVREDLELRRQPLSQLLEKISLAPTVIDVHPRLVANPINVIAEVKRSSPSKGALAKIEDPAELAHSYQNGGAAAISVLTERRRFGGSLDDLISVRSEVSIPILRKEFMVDEYQFYEARAAGADMVLLIVAALSKNQLKDYFDLATELGMASLIEVHTEAELEDAMEINPSIVGVNSRNLKTLEIDLANFDNLIPRIPTGTIAVAESGITSKAEVRRAYELGARSILVGETLVKSGDPARAINELSEL